MSFTDQCSPESAPDPVDEFDDVPVRPGLRLAWRAAVIVGCMGFALLAACSVDVGTDSDAVNKPSDIATGECLTLGPDDDPAKVAATKVDCDTTDALAFYAASTVAAGDSCTADNTSTLTFGGDGGICLTPNFTTGKCYQIPVEGGRLADYRLVDCGASAVEETVIGQTVNRGDVSVECDTDATKWSFTQPHPVGYCLREVV
ncbi:pyridine nucleotide-disulfide oxidoreductase [Gordonia sp. NPDC003376]